MKHNTLKVLGLEFKYKENDHKVDFIGDQINNSDFIPEYTSHFKDTNSTFKYKRFQKESTCE